MKHTPGSWVVLSDPPILEKEDYPISPFEIHADEGFLAGVMGEEDANLIAAAPELLDTLEEALTDWNENNYGYEYRAEWAEKARAAIEKAKGKT